MSTDLPIPVTTQAIAVGHSGVELKSIEDMFRFARVVVGAKLAPRGMDTPEKVLIALQAGMECGLTPMASLRAFIVVQGQLSWRTEFALAKVRASGLLEDIDEHIDEAGTAVAMVLRKGAKRPLTRTFSVENAKTAGLWQKRGADGAPSAWVTYPQRMLRARALGFALRDGFADVLLGLPMAEEVVDGLEVEPTPGAPPSGERSAAPRQLEAARDPLLELAFEQQAEPTAEGETTAAEDLPPPDAPVPPTPAPPSVEPPQPTSPVPSGPMPKATAKERAAAAVAAPQAKERVVYDPDKHATCPGCLRARELIATNGHRKDCEALP